MLTDSPELRSLLTVLLPGLKIESTPRPSGQRVVYFSSFDFSSPETAYDTEDEENRFLGPKWGKVVVKVSRGMHPAIIAYLEREIHILKSLKSPYYPKLHWNKTFTEDPRTEAKLSERLFITIEERINSNALSEVMGNYRNEKSVLNLIKALVLALCPLWQHHLKLVHRDIKPDNILVKKDGTIAIIDLGIVREEGKTGVTGTFFSSGPCTPIYASPEQAINDKLNITFKSDFFAIGTLAYELISGAPPFGPVSLPDYAIFENVTKLTPPSLHSLGLASEPFSSLVEKMMSKLPYKRHRTIESLLAHINSIP